MTKTRTPKTQAKKHYRPRKVIAKKRTAPRNWIAGWESAIDFMTCYRDPVAAALWKLNHATGFVAGMIVASSKRLAFCAVDGLAEDYGAVLAHIDVAAQRWEQGTGEPLAYDYTSHIELYEAMKAHIRGDANSDTRLLNAACAISYAAPYVLDSKRAAYTPGPEKVGDVTWLLDEAERRRADGNKWQQVADDLIGLERAALTADQCTALDGLEYQNSLRSSGKKGGRWLSQTVSKRKRDHLKLSQSVKKE